MKPKKNGIEATPAWPWQSDRRFAEGALKAGRDGGEKKVAKYPLPTPAVKMMTSRTRSETMVESWKALENEGATE